jgi:hypothetical protein
MTNKLSEQIAQCDVENLEPLLVKLFVDSSKNMNVYKRDLLWSMQYKPLLDIGPAGYLSAVIMLLDDDTYWRVGRDDINPEFFKAEYYRYCPNKDKEYRYSLLGDNPAQALAECIASQLEDE